MNENLTILRKGLLLIAIPFLLQLGFLGVLVKTHADNAEAQTLAIHTKQVIAKAEGVFRELIEAQNSVSGLVLTGDPSFAAIHDRAAGDLSGELRGLQELATDNPRQEAKAGQIAARAADLLAWQRETRRLAESGGRDRAVDRIKRLEGKALLGEARATIDDFLRGEERLDAERMARLARSSRRQAWVLMAGGAVAVVGVVALAVTFSRGITGRFARLAANVERLAEGKELAAPLSGRDEIAQLDRVFHEMARAIGEKNRENELFIYSVSHDLRSPLVNLQGFSQELGHASKELRGLLGDPAVPEPIRRRASRVLDQDVAGSIQFIQTAVARLSAIIDSLLRLSRAGRVEYRWQAVDVGATVDRVVEALGSSIAAKGAKVTTAAPLPEAWGDPTAVEQIFANLIGNAVQYLDPARPGLIEVGADGESRQGSSTLRTYYVRDNGLGIPESGKSKLFLAFQRFHAGAAKGEGIGLALVRRIVERHGGRIRVESEPGAGSTFFVDLPAAPADGGAAATPTFDPKGGFA